MDGGGLFFFTQDFTRSVVLRDPTPRRSRSAVSWNFQTSRLLHYAFVSWLQYALLKTSLPGLAKGSFVFFGALALSWIVTAALRRIPAVARVI